MNKQLLSANKHTDPLKEFLSTSTTEASIDKDFKEWHQGITFYGFWGIMIEDNQWLEYIRSAQTELESYLLPGYSRQAHITLNACGLLDQGHFSQACFDAQKKALSDAAFASFEVTLGHINSFRSAAYLAVADTKDQLKTIHENLREKASDSAPFEFKPHITLGLYRDQFQTLNIAEKITSMAPPDLPPISVNELLFCRYRTNEIQGPIEVLERIQLS